MSEPWPGSLPSRVRCGVGDEVAVLEPRSVLIVARDRGEQVAQVTDPVCGMRFDESKAAAVVEHGDTTHYFCSRHCADRFEADPDRFT